MSQLKQDLVVNVGRSQGCDFHDILKAYLYQVLDKKFPQKKALDQLPEDIEKLEGEIDSAVRAAKAQGEWTIICGGFYLLPRCHSRRGRHKQVAERSRRFCSAAQQHSESNSRWILWIKYYRFAMIVSWKIIWKDSELFACTFISKFKQYVKKQSRGQNREAVLWSIWFIAIARWTSWNDCPEITCFLRLQD